MPGWFTVLRPLVVAELSGVVGTNFVRGSWHKLLLRLLRFVFVFPPLPRPLAEQLVDSVLLFLALCVPPPLSYALPPLSWLHWLLPKIALHPQQLSAFFAGKQTTSDLVGQAAGCTLI